MVGKAGGRKGGTRLGGALGRMKDWWTDFF